MVRKQIAAGTTAPLYMLVGADDIEKAAVAGEFSGLVEEGLEAFNVDRLHGGEARFDAVIDAARIVATVAIHEIVSAMPAAMRQRARRFRFRLGSQARPRDSWGA